MAKTRHKWDEAKCETKGVDHGQLESMRKRQMALLNDYAELGACLRVEDGCMKLDLKDHPAVDPKGHENPFRLLFSLSSECLP